MYFPKILLFLVLACLAKAQVQQFPYTENFDTVVVPALPAGWQTTTNRSSSGDFTTTKSTPFSDSNTVISTNAVMSQSLLSPLLDFSGKEADSVQFYERRSASYNAGMLLEASTDGGSSFPIQISDTVKNTGTTSYILRAFKLPSNLSNQSSVKIRWHFFGNGTGTTGTIRFDNVIITAKVQFDVAVTALNILPQFLNAGDSVQIQGTIKNEGTQPIQNILVDFYEDLDNDSLPEINERFAFSTIHQILFPGDTIVAQGKLVNLSSGKTTIIVIASFSGDQNAANDTLRSDFFVGFARNSIVINEIMYDPKAGSSEYVELFNRGTESIDIHNWRLSDRRDANGKANEFVISKSSLIVRGREFLVVAADSSLQRNFLYLNDLPIHVAVMNKSNLSLNNDGDDVVLRDVTGMLIDSVRYSPAWHNAELADVSGRSLERINPNLSSNDNRNWSTSASSLGGTPGKQNSLYTISVPNEAVISFSPNPFSPDGDGFEDVTIMNYRLPTTTGLIRTRIFDVQGRLIRTLANGEPSGSNGEIIWDGFDDNRNKARIGIYIVLLEALDANGGSVKALKGVVVVAAKM